VYRYQLHPHSIVYVQAFNPLQHLALNRNAKQPGSGAFIRRTRNNSVRLLADFRFKHQRRRRFADLPFDFVSGILLRGKVLRQHAQFRIAIRGSSALNGSFQQALGDQIGIATIRGGGTGIVLERETKVSWGRVACKACNVFTGPGRLITARDRSGNRVGPAVPIAREQPLSIIARRLVP